jgi:hypothetical protein
LNTFAENHTAATTPAIPTAMDSNTCQTGGGLVDVSLSSVTNGATGGT